MSRFRRRDVITAELDEKRGVTLIDAAVRALLQQLYRYVVAGIPLLSADQPILFRCSAEKFRCSAE